LPIGRNPDWIVTARALPALAAIDTPAVTATVFAEFAGWRRKLSDVTGDTATEQAAARSLDPEGWVEQHGDVLFRYALLRLSSPDAAENVVQETFLAALKSQASFSGRSSERTWLVGILKHKIIDQFRKHSRETAVEDIDTVTPEEDELFDERGKWKVGPQLWRASPDAAVETAQLWSVLEACMEALPERLAAVFSLREMDELDTQEICKILQVTPTNVGVMIHRARLRLRGCLEQGGYGAGVDA
jgi:RNA polymerase sigma-70 factor (ECF subfamily)